MAVGTIFSVLSNIPWGQVVENAPKVAEAAGRLWNNVAKRGAKTGDDAASGAAVRTRDLSDVEVLSARVAALEERVKASEEQMEASSRLIKELAEQNTSLVQRIEMQRVKLRRLAIATGIACVALIALAAFALARV